MLKIHALIFLTTLIFANTSFCQRGSSSERGLYLRTNPFSFLEIDGGLMIGARYQLNKKISATLDPTFIFMNIYHEPMSDVSSPLGIKIRADVRYYFKQYSSKTAGFFVASEFHYKYRTKDRLATFGFNCVNQNCAYFMEAIYTEVKKEIGGSLKTGLDAAISNNQRLAIEVYGGLGLKIFRYQEKSIPPGGSFLSEPSHQDFFGTAEGSATPMLFGSMKVSYRLW
jgi:hypothetical protein